MNTAQIYRAGKGGLSLLDPNNIAGAIHFGSQIIVPLGGKVSLRIFIKDNNTAYKFEVFKDGVCLEYKREIIFNDVEIRVIQDIIDDKLNTLSSLRDDSQLAMRWNFHSGLEKFLVEHFSDNTRCYGYNEDYYRSIIIKTQNYGGVLLIVKTTLSKATIDVNLYGTRYGAMQLTNNAQSKIKAFVNDKHYAFYQVLTAREVQDMILEMLGF